MLWSNPRYALTRGQTVNPKQTSIHQSCRSFWGSLGRFRSRATSPPYRMMQTFRLDFKSPSTVPFGSLQSSLKSDISHRIDPPVNEAASINRPVIALCDCFARLRLFFVSDLAPSKQQSVFSSLPPPRGRAGVALLCWTQPCFH